MGRPSREQPSQRRVVPEPVDQGDSGRKVPYRLCHESPRQRVPVGGRVSDAAVVVAHVPLHRGEVQHGDEPAVRLPQRTDLLGEEGEKFPLNTVLGL